MSVFHIDRLANAGIPIEFNGKTYTARQLTMRDQGVLQAIIRKIEPDPLQEAINSSAGLDRELAREIIKDGKKAKAAYPTPITSPDGITKVLSCEEGQEALIKLSLKCTDEEANDILGNINYGEFMRLAAIAISGEDSADTEEGDAGPKV